MLLPNNLYDEQNQQKKFFYAKHFSWGLKMYQLDTKYINWCVHWMLPPYYENILSDCGVVIIDAYDNCLYPYPYRCY